MRLMNNEEKRTTRRMMYVFFVLFIFIWMFRPTKSDAGEELKARYGVVEFASNNLAGSRVGKLYQLYLGIESNIIPETLLTDFDSQLSKLWQMKEDVSGLKNVAEEARWQLIEEYSQARTPVTLKAYQTNIDQIANRTYQSINWQRMCRERGMKTRNCQTLQKIAKTIGGRELLAYGLTELMPAAEGRLNVLVLDLLLQNAGREYVESLPAIYDSYTSFGLYQFTQYAIFETPTEIRGASIVSTYLPVVEQIPGSVSKLRGDDHHKAAYLFAVRNLMRMIHRLNDRQLSTLESGWAHSDDEITQYIAVAHHSPSNALLAAKRWLDNGMKYDFSVSVSSRYLAYAKKTKVNYEALATI